MKNINGVLFPGGDTYLIDKDNQFTEYTKKLSLIYNEAKWLNDNNIYFPIWGTCLGFQVMHLLEDKNSVSFKAFDSHNVYSIIKWIDSAFTFLDNLPEDLYIKL